jgi:hypothetical protein
VRLPQRQLGRDGLRAVPFFCLLWVQKISRIPVYSNRLGLPDFEEVQSADVSLTPLRSMLMGQISYSQAGEITRTVLLKQNPYFLVNLDG